MVILRWLLSYVNQVYIIINWLFQNTIICYNLVFSYKIVVPPTKKNTQ